MFRLQPALLVTMVLSHYLLSGDSTSGQGRSTLKSGSGSKGGGALTALRAEHAAHLAAGRGTVFTSRNPLLGRMGNWVIVDAIASGSPDRLRGDLEALGMRETSQAGNVVSGRLPIQAVDRLETLNSLRFARPSYALTRAGAVDSQGDAAMHADDARVLFGVDGTGITVGTLSDSFDSLLGAAGDVTSGDLTAGIAVLADIGGGTDEGRAP